MSLVVAMCRHGVIPDMGPTVTVIHMIRTGFAETIMYRPGKKVTSLQSSQAHNSLFTTLIKINNIFIVSAINYGKCFLERYYVSTYI